jgi:hypothetical protein
MQLDQTLKKIVDGFTHIEKCTPLAVAPAQPVLGTAPITVLFWEGPIARAYLATLRDCGYKPQRIINLVSDVDIANGKTLLPWFPQIIRTPYCKVVHQSRAHYWSRYIRKYHPSFFSAIKNSIVSDFNFRGECYEEAQTTLPLSEYCEDVQDVFIENLNDRRLAKVLSKEVGTVLFTGGGIVPKNLLDIPNLNFLHVHPGKLPNYRGADCTLWSWLISGRPSGSLFYLAQGIDDGEVVVSQYTPLSIVPFDISGFDVKTIYRAVYAFLDPWVRALILRQGIIMTMGLSRIEHYPQNHPECTNYHFMHDELKKCAFDKVFRK